MQIFELKWVKSRDFFLYFMIIIKYTFSNEGNVYFV